MPQTVTECNDKLGYPHRGNKEDLKMRLRKLEGQLRGIQGMIDDDRYCVDILVQLAAVRAGLDKARMLLTESHTRGCVADAIKHGSGEEKIDELMSVLNLFLKQG